VTEAIHFVCAYRTSIDSKCLERLQDVYIPRMQVRLQAEEGKHSVPQFSLTLKVTRPSSRLEFQGDEFQHHAARASNLCACTFASYRYFRVKSSRELCASKAASKAASNAASNAKCIIGAGDDAWYCDGWSEKQFDMDQAASKCVNWIGNNSLDLAGNDQGGEITGALAAPLCCCVWIASQHPELRPLLAHQLRAQLVNAQRNGLPFFVSRRVSLGTRARRL